MPRPAPMADTIRRGPEPPDISEKGGMKDGRQQRSDQRLFMQFFAFGGCEQSRPLIEALEPSGIAGALYEDVNDPRGVGLLTLDEDPDFFLDRVRPLLNGPVFRPLVQKPEYTMLGRTYAIGYEPDLVDVLLHRLRRSGRFTQLAADEQRTILAEHGAIGMSFGVADYAHDIRLACHGLDKDDNDFVVGLIGKELYPLSAIVHTMRKTQQTSLYLERLGPFFVGRAVWQG